MEDELMKELFREGTQSMRINYHSPLPKPEQVDGLSSHSDSSDLSILYHLNEVGGPQIKKNNIWFSIKPIPDAFTTNVGDVLEIVANGTYKSIEHRGVINAKKEGLSFATFHGPNLDEEFGPAASFVSPQTPALFERVSIKYYRHKFFISKLNQKSNIDRWRILNHILDN